jgi:Mn-dependent DtxR family transcriptional regulator
MDPKESSEDYLETILILSKKLPVVRSVDVANELGYKKSSISVAMKKLRERKLITMDENGYINLTEEGAKIAEAVYSRHILFTNWLTELGVDSTIAAEDACRIEHIISEESYQAIKDFIINNHCKNYRGKKSE